MNKQVGYCCTDMYCDYCHGTGFDQSRNVTNSDLEDVIQGKFKMKVEAVFRKTGGRVFHRWIICRTKSNWYAERVGSTDGKPQRVFGRVQVKDISEVCQKIENMFNYSTSEFLTSPPDLSCGTDED